MQIAEDDYLPEEGKFYVFLAFQQPADTDNILSEKMTVSCPTSNILLEGNNLSDIQQSDTYKLYVDAVKNEILYDIEGENH